MIPGLGERLLEVAAAFALLAAVFVPLEHLFRATAQPIFRREWGTDLLFFLGQYLLWAGLAAASLVRSPLVGAAPTAAQVALAELPWWLQATSVILLGDLLVYWGHRLSHAVPLLWRFHRVHHTAEQLDWLAAHREHPLDGLYTQALVNLPALALGFPLETLAGVAAFRGMWGLFIHSNTTLSPGPMKVLLGAPALHRWHHDLDRGCNYANLMPLMDLLFGTYYDPGTPPPALGIREPVRRGYLGLLSTLGSPGIQAGGEATTPPLAPAPRDGGLRAVELPPGATGAGLDPGGSGGGGRAAG